MWPDLGILRAANEDDLPKNVNLEDLWKWLDYDEFLKRRRNSFNMTLCGDLRSKYEDEKMIIKIVKESEIKE